MAADGNEGRPWSVDRWGRLLAGASTLLFAGLALAHHPWWTLGAVAVGGNLLLTSITDHCPLHDLLIRLGAREREDLFYPGGGVRGRETRDGRCTQTI